MLNKRLTLALATVNQMTRGGLLFLDQNDARSPGAFSL
jgi:hypothetical protein